MKSVLIIDGSPLTLEYVKNKLSAEQITVEIASGKRDAYTKMITLLPNLVLIDVEESLEDYTEFFESKFNDPNARQIPIVIVGPAIEHTRAAQLLQYGVVKYFSRPTKFDIFFESIGRIINNTISIDPTPCICEVHTNSSVIFIELSSGLNREKLALLKFKLADILDNSEIKDPKIVLMLTNISLTYVDGINVEMLFDNILSDSRIKAKDIQVLTNSQFLKDLVQGHPEYSDVQIAESLLDISSKLVDTGTDELENVVSDKILASSEFDMNSSVETRFHSDLSDSKSIDGTIISVAVVDDDVNVRTVLNNAFQKLSANVTMFSNGQDFINALSNQTFDVIILDIYMQGLSGIDVLRHMQGMGVSIPTIMYSQSPQRELIVQSLSLGARSYVVKPQKPEVIVQKALSVLNK